MSSTANTRLSKTKSEMSHDYSHLESESLIAFPTLFAEQLAKTPDNIAIIFEKKQFSYKQLDELSDQFKHAILDHRRQYDTATAPQANEEDFCIGICIDKSPEAIAAMLGILKSGAAFVPLDPEFPADRIAYMVSDANINTIIVQPKHQKILAPALSTLLKKENKRNTQEIHWIDCNQPTINNTKIQPLPTPDVVIEPNDLAYIMYTSGSTGKPKGVQIEHAALATYCYADIEMYQVVESDRTLQFSTINFDIAIEEIFPPLITGGCIVIRPSEYSEKLNELSGIIDQYKVTAVHIATAYWHEWVDLMIASNDFIPESLRLMVVTGEKVSTKHYQRWKQLSNPAVKDDVLWCNAYGPTEATVSASVFIPDENFDKDNMPIGKTLKRYTARIVDENYKDLPAGETGQLLIGGPALARGYLNRPKLNEDVFINIEAKQTHDVKRLVKMYKTGDLARWLPDGNIEFAGRIDHQIKLGSYRIEPGEIEVAINEHKNVLESLITYDEVDGKKTLIAYIALDKEAMASGNIGSYEIASFLQTNLPAYMVPSRYVLLASFPKTTNGKIDRKALPDPTTSEVARSSSFIAPRDELEIKLSKIWQEVLQLSEVSIYDDFFALGGSSLIAVGIVSRIVTDLKLELPVRDFFANPTIESQARHIKQMLGLKVNHSSEQGSVELRKRLPALYPNFFKSGDNDLYGVHYQPNDEHTSRSHAVLICHPSGHEYSRSYRNLQQFSIQLAQLGFDTFRFDYTGTGNSSGDVVEHTSEQSIKDIQSARNYIVEASQCEHLSIIAVRVGAPLAVKAFLENLEESTINKHSNTTTDTTTIKNIIIWDPVIHGSNYLALLQKFHMGALTGLQRYKQKRNVTSKKQLFGYAMSDKKTNSFAQLNMPKTKLLTAKKELSVNKILITSAHYVSEESGCAELASDWQHYPNTDNIYWHDSQNTESAFSSPQTFQTMMKILMEEYS